MTVDQKFEAALVECMSQLRDVSLRDGVQSYDANKWPIANILPVATKLNRLAQLVHDKGGKMAPIEVWGGGQVSQPANFLKEDPIRNLDDIKAAMPDADLQCLYRGRQGFGFIPVSAEVQMAAIEASGKHGIKVVRIFDMMNDIENLKNGFNALKKYNELHADAPLTIEGAVSYISEPEGGKRAWALEDYANYAVALVNEGAHEIAIKDYAGVGNGELPALVKAIRAKLDAAGMTQVPVNVHSHGQKPEILVEVLKHAGKGAKVDVAFGDLSGGPAHTNIFDVLRPLMEAKGFTKEAGYNYDDLHMWRGTAVGMQLLEVQDEVNQQAATFKAKRPPAISQQQVDRYRMAGGALSDLWSNYIKTDADFKKYQQQWKSGRLSLSDPQREKLPPIPETKQAWFEMVLESCPALWEQAGRFNTVTPGAAILCQQAVLLANQKLSGQPITMASYTEQYLGVVKGRYGRNMGMERGIGDQDFLKAALLFGALQKINTAVKNGAIPTAVAHDLYAAALGVQEAALSVSMLKADGTLNLSHMQMESLLRKSDLEYFKKKVSGQDLGEHTVELPPDLREQLMFELTPGRSPEPKDGLAKGKEILAGTGYEEMHTEGKRISAPADVELLAMLLRKGGDDNLIIRNMVSAIGKDIDGRDGGDAASRLQTQPMSPVEGSRVRVG